MRVGVADDRTWHDLDGKGVKPDPGVFEGRIMTCHNQKLLKRATANLLEC
jgi:hypothetical protein